MRDYAIVPPESPVLNGGDWLDLGTRETIQLPDANGQYPVGPARRVPVVPTWTCPDCGGVIDARAAVDHRYGCQTCHGLGVVHQGWLALGAATHRRWWADNLLVPASLSELVRVQRVPVLHRDDKLQKAWMQHLTLEDGKVKWWVGPDYARGHVPSTGQYAWLRGDITDQFSSPPNPGGWVWRIVERVTLSDPITETVDECQEGRCELCLFNEHRRVPLPQQVGWYQADDALVAEIERHKKEGETR